MEAEDDEAGLCLLVWQEIEIGPRKLPALGVRVRVLDIVDNPIVVLIWEQSKAAAKTAANPAKGRLECCGFGIDACIESNESFESIGSFIVLLPYVVDCLSLPTVLYNSAVLTSFGRPVCLVSSC